MDVETTLSQTWIQYSIESAICVQSVDVQVSCSSHSDTQLAAFFIDPRAKWSTVQCCNWKFFATQADEKIIHTKLTSHHEGRWANKTEQRRWSLNGFIKQELISAGGGVNLTKTRMKWVHISSRLDLCHDKRAHIKQILKLLTTIKPTLMCLNPLIMSTGHRTFTQPTGKSRKDVPPARLNTVLKAIRRHTKAPKFQKWIRNPKQQPH